MNLTISLRLCSKTKTVLRVIYVILLISSGLILKAQDLSKDTTTISNSSDNKNSFTSIFYGQPGKAALYSLLIPGGGQFYNRRIWKIPLVYAGEGFAAYNLLKSLRSFRDKDQCWKSFVTDASNPDPICGTTDNLGSAFDLRQSARSGKEVAWIIMSVAHLMNVVEAFVDRHLINFDTSEDLSIHNLPNYEIVNHGFDIQPLNFISIKIPLNSD